MFSHCYARAGSARILSDRLFLPSHVRIHAMRLPLKYSGVMDVPQSGIEEPEAPLQRLSLPLSSTPRSFTIPQGELQTTYLPSGVGNGYLAQAMQSTGRVGICPETQRAGARHHSLLFLCLFCGVFLFWFFFFF